MSVAVRRYGWRALAVVAVAMAVYAAGIAGNGFWGYAAASEISSGQCTTSTSGQEVCVTRFCQEGTGGTTRCTTYTTTCTPPDTRGQRSCYTTTSERTCTSAQSGCEPIGERGDCRTDSTGTERCVTRTCSADGNEITCQRTTITCVPATSSGTRPPSSGPPPPVPSSGTGGSGTPSCTFTTVRETCTTDPRSCTDGPHQLGEIRGRVRDGQDAPIAGANVQVLTGRGTVVAEATTNAEGRFAVTQLRAVSYRVRFVADGFRTELFRNAATLDDADPVAVPEGGSATASARLARAVGRVAGTVRDAARAPIEGAMVSLLEPDGDVVAERATTADGRYRLTGVEPGEYRVGFAATGFVSELYENAATLPDADPVEVVANETTSVPARLRRSRSR